MLIETLQCFNNKDKINVTDVCDIFSKGLYSGKMFYDLHNYIKSSKLKYKGIL